MKAKKYLSLLLILAMVISLMAGCSSSESAETEKTPAQETASEDVTTEENQPEAEESTSEDRYPLADHDVTLSIFLSMPGNTMSYFADMSDHVAYAWAIERLGVDLEFVTSSLGNTEQYALWAASGEFPDILTVNPTSSITQGVDYAVENEIFLPLNDYLEEYAPEYEAYRTRSEDSIKASVSDGGNIVTFDTVVLEYDDPATGPMIRQDWLDAIGLDTPVTYDDWHDVLTAFKTEYDPYAPLMLPESAVGQNNTLIAGYGVQGFEADTTGSGRVAAPLYQIDGEVYFSLTQPAYKDYISMLADWYSEGLIAPDFVSISSSTMGVSDLENYVITDKTGIWVGEMRVMSDYEDKAVSESFKISAIADAVLEEGDQIHFDNDRTGRGEACISGTCEHPEIAVAWMNYWYTEEGQDIVNWGFEGQSYEVVDGQKQYTDLLLNNPEGMTFSTAKLVYTCDMVSVSDFEAESYTYTDTQIQAGQIWASNRDNDWSIPSSLTLTQEENEEYARIYSDINTYAGENVVRFVMGEKSMDEWDSFIAQIESMGSQDLVDIYQTAMDRYNQR